MKKEKQPVLNIIPLTADITIEILAYTALIALWIFVLVIYSELPGEIPTHFDISGKADGFGSRETIFLAPAICTALFIFMSIIQRKPHWFNYAVEITPENAQKQYTIAVKMIRLVKLSVVLIFGLIEFHTYKASAGMEAGPGQYIILAVLALVYIPLFYYLVQSSKNA